LVCFLQFFLLFFDISKLFCRHNESVEWISFSPICLYTSFELLCSVNFFHLNRFRNQNLPPKVFLGKFQHPFSTPKHYNLAIYVVKWLQILYVINNIYTTRLYVWDLCNLVTFKFIRLWKQWCFFNLKRVGALSKQNLIKLLFLVIYIFERFLFKFSFNFNNAIIEMNDCDFFSIGKRNDCDFSISVVLMALGDEP